MVNQRAIEGKNVNVRAYYIDGWYPFACATKIDFQSDQEMIERTGPNSGQWKEFEGRLNEWGFTLESVTHIVPSPGIGTHLTVFHALQESIRREGLLLEMSFVDSAGNIKTIKGKCLIPSIGISASADGFSQDTITFKGTGAYNEGTIIEPTPENPENIMPYDVLSGSFFGTDGQTSATVSALNGTKLIEVSRGYPLEIIYSGTPTESQVKVTTSTGTQDGVLTSSVLTFGAPMIAGEYVFYIYKKY